MSNVFIYYIFPLLLGIVFFIIGLTVFWRFGRGDRNANGKKGDPVAGVIGLVFSLVGGIVVLAILFTSPTPGTRQRLFQHIFHTPPERIERFIIKAGAPKPYQPLTPVDVVIDDPARIRQIAEILSKKVAFSPNHPEARWTTQVEMVTSDGVYHFSVCATLAGDANGTLIYIWSNPGGDGWNLGTFHANGLETILEDAVKSGGRAEQ